MASEEVIDRAMTARLLTVVISLYLLFVFYGSWVPLHFTPRPLPWAFQTFAALPFFDQTFDSATDWATNFLLLIPFSFLLAQRLVPVRREITGLAIRFALIGLCVVVAFTLEFSQLFFPPRIVSQKDILALSLGAVVGIATQHHWGMKVENWLAMLWQRENQQTRLIRLLHVFLLVLFAFSVLPLDLTVSLVELHHKWREGRIVLMPFGGLKGGVFNNLYETVTDVLIWVPVGLFLTLDRNSSVIKVALVGFLAAAVIETAQLFVYSRVTDVTDVFLAGVGTAMGGWLANRGSKTFALLAEARAGFWFSIWAGWAIAVFCVFWFPFNFRTAGVTLDSVLSALTRLPFFMLYEGSEFQAVNEMLRKIGFFLLGGILWVLGATAHREFKGGSKSKLYGILAFAAVALIIEAGQLFIPGKNADFTDVLLKTGGGLLGMILTRWVLGGRNSSRDLVVPGNAAISPAELRKAAPPPQRIADPAWKNHLLTFFGLSLAVGILTRLPFVPYNIRELNSPGIAGLFSSLGLAMAIFWIANGHFHFLRWSGQDRMLALPAWLGLHGMVAWILIRATIPMESIHDILGFPVLDWPWEWELIGRYLALHTVIGMQAIGAILFVTLICHCGKVTRLMIWLIFAVTLSWPLHMIVVDAAATDNLTELMRNGGSFSSSTLLASGILAFFITGSAISAIFAISGHRLKAVILATIASVVAAVAFWFGSEQVILKYGKVFSAWQFLLSASRLNYAFGTELFMRYLAAYVLMACALGLVQMSHIKAFCQGTASSRNR